MAYCERIHQRRQQSDAGEKRFACEAFDIRARWLLGGPLAIEGAIPLGEMVWTTTPPR
jgi:hypothetical protein